MILTPGGASFQAGVIPAKKREQAADVSEPQVQRVASQQDLMNSIIIPKSNLVKIPLTFGGRGLKQVTVMSYNMLNMTENATWYGKPKKGKSAEGIRALGEVIKREDPDIIAVQEVQNSDVLQKFSTQELAGGYSVVCPSSSGSRGLPTGIMYKNDIELAEWKTHAPKTPKGEPIFMRDLLQANFKFKTPDGCEETMIVLSAHYKAMVGGEAKTTPQRVQEAQATAKIIAKIKRENPDSKVVLMGDLNFKADTTYGKQVMAALLSEKDANNLPVITEIFGENPPPTHQFKNQGNKLDYIFVTQNLKRDLLEARVSGKFGVAPWSLASDHLPPVGVLKTRCKHQPVNEVTRIGTATQPPTPIQRPGKRISFTA